MTHLAQLTVHPSWRGRHVTVELVEDVAARGAACGFEHMTLIVGEHNHRAMRLYRSRGFEPCVSFLAARVAL